MKIINLSENNSILNQFLKELRSTDIQHDSMRFRRNLERIGELTAYEMSKQLNYRTENISTPLSDTTIQTIAEPIVLSTILRAGLPFHQGFLNYFDSAENAFVSAYRLYSDENNFTIHTEYIASPDLTGKTLIICDPMLATGSSMETAHKALLEKGSPSKIYLASVIATEKAINYLNSVMPEDAVLYTAAIDPILNEHAYIVPGLGDAGDLAFGEKL
ncbi:MAG: uracil phosphoribosyltransferase [Paludibacter sp.]|nr:uracil phosphoribosyltransferase [Bacteroidales bacterium]MCM1069990.1 uracil phosphoribosyltransferase [Prevotella sp.]MCM1354732.1 uracil phosphoribosyltransferase [Bacteroides sp.]MCM1443594.1 uracil phosphoribosyltransferase [Muribaculum sp.]MCM1482669.1 uracil phosphoribosyltransferase [Paludibacter sp.]